MGETKVPRKEKTTTITMNTIINPPIVIPNIGFISEDYYRITGNKMKNI
ncbi:hypothetical protein BG20_I1056 [Candidatus Nitrosarchaeum limnium BG20]|uniref:Uncharacterized protein n=1 Tax=Candidatus Nitrosarchaeum limnium BG20 TaxID=859192 RepID=S2E899_9ARCH|nr:hypothetical protein BG20_I1056 [Candidatus Nitrosarchaeum limnium BG20]